MFPAKHKLRILINNVQFKSQIKYPANVTIYTINLKLNFPLM